MDLTLDIPTAANSDILAVSTTSAATGVINALTPVALVISCTERVALCQGPNPTAVFPASGTPGHQVVEPGVMVRVVIKPGNKLAAILAAGTSAGVLHYGRGV